jgi:hypothetical protein
MRSAPGNAAVGGVTGGCCLLWLVLIAVRILSLVWAIEGLAATPAQHVLLSILAIVFLW